MESVHFRDQRAADDTRHLWPPVLENPTLAWDPYLLWACITHFRGSGKIMTGSMRLQVVVEMSKAFNTIEDLREACPPAAGISIPGLYFGQVKSRYLTAEVSLSDLPSLMTFDVSPFRRIELGMDRGITTPGLLPPVRIGSRGGNRRLVVGVIDDICAYAHEAFRDPDPLKPNESRIKAVWTQDETTGLPSPPDIPYGSQRAYADLSPGGSIRLSDDQWYAATSDDRIWPRATHGTHVLDLAAGAPRPTLLDTPAAGSTMPAPDHAATASLLFVELPRLTVKDVSGGSLGVHLLDGMRYLMESTLHNETNLVVNVSYGNYGGPHDGSSIIEEAMDDLLRLRDNFAIVLPAGNAHIIGKPIHAHCPLLQSGRTAEVAFQVIVDDSSETFVQIWLPLTDINAADLHASVQLRAPDGSSTPWASLGDIELLTQNGPGTPVLAAAMFLNLVSQGTKAKMALVGIVPTASTTNTACASPGAWTLAVRNDGPAAIENIHAWIERHDSLPDSPDVGHQPFFIDESANGFTTVGRKYTLNSLANGDNTLCAGGLVKQREPNTSVDAVYSGHGPGRDESPRAPIAQVISDAGIVLKGVRAAGARTGGTVRMSGTSMSSGWLARFVANKLQEQAPGLPDVLTNTQIHAFFAARKSEVAVQKIDESQGLDPYP
ncbi:S8/S53 family peptidase [Piscinibacter terrae]|uniref:S8 family serine peptidase n=1 Tax=Piscinibacter terrae TaxID=2496871 RepID=UPI00138720E0|nr:S8 family serine peptidase [Albitalea terrae]